MAKKIKNELLEKEVNVKDYKSDIDKYIKSKVEEEFKKTVNIKDYKDQIDKYAKERVEIESASHSVKMLKNQLHNKKIASAIKSFIILCLLLCAAYGVYYLYKDGYFDENKKTKCPVNNSATTKPVDPDNKVKEKDPEVTQEELKQKYSYLLDGIIFDANSNYTRDYYNGNLTNEIKLYLSYKLMDKEEVTQTEYSTFFDASILASSYEKIFNDEVKLTSFKYNNASYVYLPGKEIYMTSAKPNDDKNITREILNISIDEDKNVIITCVEGYLTSNNKLYNILTNKEVYGFKPNDTLVKHKDKLSVINYVFTDNYLTNIYK